MPLWHYRIERHDLLARAGTLVLERRQVGAEAVQRLSCGIFNSPVKARVGCFFFVVVVTSSFSKLLTDYQITGRERR